MKVSSVFPRYLVFIVLFALGLMTPFAQAQTRWSKLDRVPEPRTPADQWVKPKKFNAVALDHAAMRIALARAPREVIPGFVQPDLVLELPMPDGSTQRFSVAESPIMAPELAVLFPEIKTYVAQGLDDPTASARLDMTPAGFHAQILSVHGAVYIDPLLRDASAYASYYKRDNTRDNLNFQCLTPATTSALTQSTDNVLSRSGGNLRTFRLAVAATAEYTAFHGGTVSAGLAAVVTAVNRVTGVYETELSVRFVLVANNNLIIYTSAAGDPYTNNNASSLLNENQSNLDSVIGSANYDVGHVFSTAGGGLASLGSFCVTGSKARGETGLGAPTGDSFVIDFVAHELGHQMGANHTFNSSAGNCGGGNRNGSTAYEIGSGSTIMAYAGICDTDDLQPHSDPYFHSISFDEIISAIGGGACSVVTSTGNSAPTVNAGANYTIPASTPFILTAIGSDPNGDPLTYCWEERDLGASTTLLAADNGSSPIFRVFNPTTNAWRTFPKLSDILNNTVTPGEKLPTTSRTMNFRVTARDNRAGAGGVNTDDAQVTVVSTAGPFVVTSQASGGTFSNAITVAWNVANTAASPINAASVTISLSTNGGQTFPITLLASTPNDGSESVVLPNINNSQARLKVQGSGNIFFDVNASNFSIIPGIPAPLVSLDSFTLLSESCGTGNAAIDPGETVTVSVGLRNSGSANTTNLVATLLSGGGVTSPSGAQSFGVIPSGGGVVFQTYTFTATGTCAGALSAALSLQDGPTAYPTVAADRTLGGFTNAQFSFTNSGAVTVPANGNKGKGSPYPSTISVAGVSGPISKITVTLAGVGHSYPDDLDVLLVSPSGQKVMLLSDAGGATAVTGLTMTFDDSALTAAPDSATLSSGTFLPSAYDTASDAFPSPAPASPYATTLSTFNGASANGTWSLFTLDDATSDTGSLTGGWRLNITTTVGSCCSEVVNNPPNFPTLTNRVVTELQNLTFTVPATDPDGNTLSFALSGAPLNATIGAANGVFDWTPAENQGPSSNYMQVIVTDNGTPSLSATQSLVVIVNDENSAPQIVPLAQQILVEGGTLVVTNVANDTDIPLNTISFSLTGAPPTNATIHPVSGVVNWPTTEFDGPGTNLIHVVATDNGSPSLSSTQSFLVIVLESNSPPSLTAISSRTIHAGGTVTFTNSASDSDWPTNALTFLLDPGAPPGAGVVSNGVFQWFTTDADANTTNALTVRVVDNGVPALDAARNFSITVLGRPLFTSISNESGNVIMAWTAIAGESYRLQFISSVTDTNWTDVAGDIAATTDSASTTNVVDAAEKYYRVRWLGQ